MLSHGDRHMTQAQALGGKGRWQPCQRPCSGTRRGGASAPPIFSSLLSPALPSLSDSVATICQVFILEPHLYLSPFWILCIQWSGDTGKAGERDDDKSHFLAQQGEKRLLQRSLPHV